MDQRRRHSHMTCGFCLQPKIVRSKPHETKGCQPIYPDCLTGLFDRLAPLLSRPLA